MRSSVCKTSRNYDTVIKQIHGLLLRMFFVIIHSDHRRVLNYNFFTTSGCTYSNRMLCSKFKWWQCYNFLRNSRGSHVDII